MYHESAQETARIAGASLVAGDGSVAVSAFCIDSRTVSDGDTFVCFPGENVDGNDFAMAAFEAGAAVVVMTREPEASVVTLAEQPGRCLLRAADDNAEGFLERLGAWYRERQDWVVVGVTGSVGKTTTKDMLAAALATRYRVHSTKGNFNSVIGAPLTVLEAPDDIEALVCEMGMNHWHEIDRICRVTRPQVACVTNIGTAHIGFLGSRENIARAKSECVRWLADPLPAFEPVDPALVLCSDDDFTPFIAETFAAPQGVPVVRVGEHEGDAVRASDVEVDDHGHPSFSVASEGESARVTLRLTGRQNVPDFLLCAGCAERVGVSLDQAARAAEALEPSPMRSRVLEGARGFRIIDDCYNASPASVAAALDLLAQMACEGRRVAVLGQVGELGDEARVLHGLMGAYLAAKPVDLAVFVGGEDAATMEEAARTMGFSEDRCVLVADVDEAVRVVAPILEPGDVVLVKGSRSVGLDRFVKEVRA